MSDIIPRHASGSLGTLLEMFPVVAVVGARQVGKSTLVAQFAPSWETFDLERGQDLDLVSHDPDLFLERHPRRVIIDEAQELPPLFPALRVAVDRHRSENGRFVITGSSSPELLTSISESLAGRVGMLELGTFKATERWRRPPSAFYRLVGEKAPVEELARLPVQLTRDELFETWVTGGYPEVARWAGHRARRIWMDNYRVTYLNRDIRRLFPGLDVERYRTFLTMLARLSGTIINHSELARALSVSQPTVARYIDIADGTFLWRKLGVFTRNVTRRVTRMPRGHVRDPGLLHFLLNIGSEDALHRDPIVGRSWESFVTEEILKGFVHELVPLTASYYRTHHGAEIDLVLEGDFGVLPIEIKLGTTLDPRTLRPLRAFVDEHGLGLGLVINNSDRPGWVADKILRLPANVL